MSPSGVPAEHIAASTGVETYESGWGIENPQPSARGFYSGLEALTGLSYDLELSQPLNLLLHNSRYGRYIASVTDRRTSQTRSRVRPHTRS